MRMRLFCLLGFQDAAAFNADLVGWNVASVSTAYAMLSGASRFNQRIKTWNVAAVANAGSMLSGASAFNQEVGAWNVASVSDMSAMFSRASAFDQMIENWNVQAVSNMVSMFNAASVFDQNIAKWNVLAARQMTQMFDSAAALSVANKLSIYNNWGATIQALYPAFGPPTPAPTPPTSTQAPSTHAPTQAPSTPSPSAHCVVGAWSIWCGCSQSCDAGSRARSRSIVQPQGGAGTACPATTDAGSCNSFSCPVDCATGSWAAWAACTASCGGGQTSRVRSVLAAASDGGAQCPSSLTELSSCSTFTCPVDCSVGPWQVWGACSATCGAGSQKQRTRAVQTAASGGGQPC